ncbi:MAG: UvrD-helicase domain-containing protein [Myxococcaceae bacterium]
MRQLSLLEPRQTKLETPLALERNVALMAGAGAGKTYSLVTICLHLLTGARSRPAVRTSQLYLMTFTDKAAGELRDRLRRRMDDLASGRSGEPETLLKESFAKLERPYPTRDEWRRLRDDLGAAFIGTFHSLCVQLLRRAPPGFGVDPAFELLDEREAAALIHDVAERVVLAAIEAGDPHLSDLCRELNFSGAGRALGLVDLLTEKFAKIREEGVDPAQVAITDGRQARREFDQALASMNVALQEARAGEARKKTNWGPTLEDVARVLPKLTFENFHEPRGYPALRQAFGHLGVPGKGDNKEAIKALKYGCLGPKDSGVIGLNALHATCTVEAYENAFRTLLCELRDRHREELDRRTVLDFSELLIRTRDLLRDQPMVRREVQGRVGALLVDEFQDTNRLQLEIVTMLSEERAGAARELHSSEEILSLPLEPAFLCAVGDRKQSIYEFRGADVSVFELLAKQIERGGGTRAFLKTNHRSSPSLLRFFNSTFADVMHGKDDARDYEVVYAPQEDDLLAWRKIEANGPPVERLTFDPPDDTHEARLAEADFLARRIKALLSEDAPKLVVSRDETARRPRGGDIALLFRAFTQLETYRQALIRHGIPHRVVGGRGFYAAQEVLDLASLLKLVADPHDLTALTAVLRSPLVGLTDSNVFRLSGAPESRLSLRRVADLSNPARPHLSDDERTRLDRFLQVHKKLRRERDRLGLRLLLKVALDELGYRTAIAGTSFGEQALANLDKLSELAGRWDEDGLGDCEAFARELLGPAQTDPREEQADTLDSSDPRAVQLLTIHRAKGLEWPIVIVPDLAAKKQNTAGNVLYDRRLGLALKPLLPDGGLVDSPRTKTIRRELARREDAQSQRLLYVALTRARDRLILSGVRNRPDGWRKSLDQIIDGRGAQTLGVAELRPEQLPEPRPPSERDHAADLSVLRAKIERARRPLTPAPASVVFPVTQLQDFVRCPRRYLYLHQIGLSEAPMVLELAPEDAQEGAEVSAMDPRMRGTLAHRLLEKVDWALVPKAGQKLRDHLRELLVAEGIAKESREAVALVADVEAFLGTAFCKRLAKLGVAKLHRELPFLLRLGGEGSLAVHLRGQIDLLVEDEDGGATVVDYKFAEAPEDVFGTYGFQLDCYALAAKHFVQDGVAIRTGLAFLKGGPREPDFREVPSAEQLSALESNLVQHGRTLLEASQSGAWAGIERKRCQALRCGYQYRCHPGAAGL